MKRIIIAAAFLAGFNFGFSQETKTEDKDLMTWYHKDFSTTNVYGVNTQNAYKFFESKGLKPKWNRSRPSWVNKKYVEKRKRSS